MSIQLDFHKPVHIHFIGIGGISMSGLAEILLNAGFTVSGSDRASSPLTKELENKGAVIAYKQCADNITPDIDCVVYTAAISTDNPELSAAAKQEIPLLTRAELLGQLMKNYSLPVAISGTHGKTTTTSMITHILLEAELDPTVSVGGILPVINGNVRVGGNEYFVTEACEYTNSFLSFFPKASIILNIDSDHLDFFKDLDDIRHSFMRFAALLPSDGILIINGEIENLSEITKDLTCNIVTFGSTAAQDYYFSDETYDEKACASYTLHRKDKKDLRVSLSVPGKHNILNSLAAIALSDHLKVPEESCLKALQDFTGTERRFEKKGELGGITIIDDYAHHPTEIAATLKAAASYPHNKLWVVFQPHTYTRTKALMDEFAEVLATAENIILADIYAARERDTLGISSRTLKEKIEALGKTCHYFPSFDEIENFLLKSCSQGDVLITMGAGDVVKIGEHLLGK